jgi:hypothetical protein
MLAQDWYFRVLAVAVVVVELLSLYRLRVTTGASFAQSESSSSVYLAPPILVVSRVMKVLPQLSPFHQLSPSQPLRDRPSVVVESCQLIDG